MTCCAVTLFAAMGALVKLLSSNHAAIQIVWARTLGHLLFVLLLFMPRRGFAIMRTQRFGTQMSRSTIQILSTTFFFSALAVVPLAEATTISFLSPLFVILLAAVMLGERITPRRMVAIVAGLIGVVIVMRPGSAVFQWPSLLIVGSATCYALYQVLTRRVGAFDPPETSVVYSALVGTVLASISVPFFWTTPTGLRDALALVSVGILGGAGHYLVARALVNAPASVVAPFQYLQLVGAVCFGYFLFDNVPTVHTWIGAAIIIGSGLYIGWNESRRRQAE